MRARRPLAALAPAAALVAALVAGCGEPAAPAPAGPAGGPSGTAAASPAVVPITVTVRGGRVTPEPGRITVDRGARVRITVTSDAPDEFHLHGYDRALDLRPGSPAVLELTCDVPGVFEAELHHSGARVFELQVG
ncbi:hypothetical protein [Thermomonospora cellulosilytica]|uniref:EfeO-type cupredoxin-like domain-containing protein n=1 Tax=Thermomonospora cellulosilytica TaxID=1411118 RepID=A0A7W3N1E6_9ACTN|nr:hypothetical protein [Thermomonospora cellulosilytica]MBA9005771.1 hypothetical protein [Thermomonospora cellulosilytica]